MRVRPEQPVVGDSARRVDPYRRFLGRTRLAQGEADEENDQSQGHLNPSHVPILPDAVRVQQGVSPLSKPRGHDAGALARYRKAVRRLTPSAVAISSGYRPDCCKNML